jgi:5-oxoprolinase (ATP-hydrolysing)
VLSTGALRGRVAAWDGPRSFRPDTGWRVPEGFFRGWELRWLGRAVSSSRPRTVADSDAGGTALLLDGPAGEVPAGAHFELRSPEEAPVLAARLVTGTPLDRPLPEIALRLATTRGTNALLERKGAATALFITRGFADLLRIGTQQRPDLFALRIVRPEPLFREVVEVPERLAADGAVVAPLDPDAVRCAARRLLGQGIGAAAVALLHSDRHPRHEEEVGALLREAGFRHVSLSSRLAPVIKLLPRAETAVVDAYLAPVLQGYLAGVSGALPRGTLHVMTSAGGLVRAEAFRPKDSLLSGPAGGVVGAARAGRRSGFARVLAFDMGGTSTDVARWDGDFEYVFEHQVGDAHLVAPALAIESVAAGGGSICGFDGSQLRVGPESAGAWPGPACYGAGGPFTLTDVNLLLGRLDPERFEIPLDAGAAERAFVNLLARLAVREGTAPPREAVLEGLLEIADERMAEAIRGISLRRGYDPADHALVAFGGAGGQHACALAGLLGIGRVVVPRDAGLLSALGLGAATVERFAQRQVLAPLAAVHGGLEGWLDELGREASAAVAAEGVPAERIAVRRRILNLRFAGQEEPIPVEPGPGETAESAFESAYRALYGYAPEGRAIEVESVRVVASSAVSEGEEEDPQEPAPREAVPAGHRLCWIGGDWRDVPAFDRAALASGDAFAGPCLVFESHSGTVIAEGWSGRIDATGALVLARVSRVSGTPPQLPPPSPGGPFGRATGEGDRG